MTTKIKCVTIKKNITCPKCGGDTTTHKQSFYQNGVIYFELEHTVCYECNHVVSVTMSETDTIRDEVCELCGGSGYARNIICGLNPIVCPDCNGTGKVKG